MNIRPALVVMTRLPRPGRAKTRLAPVLGAAGAARLQRRLTEAVMVQARRLALRLPARLVVSFADGKAEEMRAWLGQGPDYQPQVGGDLGARMAAALERALSRGAPRAVLVGSDVPGLDEAVLTQAFSALADHDLVLGPSHDGGYYLVGLRRPCPQLFEGISWSSGRVLAQSLAVARDLGLRVALLKRLRDVDRPGDIKAWLTWLAQRAGAVSVVIPALNEEEAIGRSVGSALAGGAFEVIVVDGGSQDRTMAAAEAAGALTVASPPGRARQMNLGASLAQGEHLLFLHADTRLPPGWAREVRRILDRPGVAGGAFRFRLDHRPPSLRFIELAVDLRCRLASLPYGDQAIFLPAAVFRRVGGYPGQPIMEDVELVRRIKRLGRVVVSRRPALTSARRWRGAGVWKTTGLNYLMMIAYGLGVRPGLLRRIYDRADAGRPSPRA